jgi:hypothetical protein
MRKPRRLANFSGQGVGPASLDITLHVALAMELGATGFCSFVLRQLRIATAPPEIPNSAIRPAPSKYSQSRGEIDAIHP